jgi:hypothetical protein
MGASDTLTYFIHLHKNVSYMNLFTCNSHFNDFYIK